MTELEQYIKADRQWTRDCRIARARAFLTQAKGEEQDFWVEVLRANGFYDK